MHGRGCGCLRRRRPATCRDAGGAPPAHSAPDRRHRAHGAAHAAAHIQGRLARAQPDHGGRPRLVRHLQQRRMDSCHAVQQQRQGMPHRAPAAAQRQHMLTKCTCPAARPAYLAGGPVAVGQAAGEVEGLAPPPLVQVSDQRVKLVHQVRHLAGVAGGVEVRHRHYECGRVSCGGGWCAGGQHRPPRPAPSHLLRLLHHRALAALQRVVLAVVLLDLQGPSRGGR